MTVYAALEKRGEVKRLYVTRHWLRWSLMIDDAEWYASFSRKWVEREFIAVRANMVANGWTNLGTAR